MEAFSSSIPKRRGMANPKIRSFGIVRENPRLCDCCEEEQRDDECRYDPDSDAETRAAIDVGLWTVTAPETWLSVPLSVTAVVIQVLLVVLDSWVQESVDDVQRQDHDHKRCAVDDRQPGKQRVIRCPQRIDREPT